MAYVPQEASVIPVQPFRLNNFIMKNLSAEPLK